LRFVVLDSQRVDDDLVLTALAPCHGVGQVLDGVDGLAVLADGQTQVSARALRSQLRRSTAVAVTLAPMADATRCELRAASHHSSRRVRPRASFSCPRAPA
jgi:hypothetical protein